MSDCIHSWSIRGRPDDVWSECWFCGAIKPEPLPDDLAHREIDPMGSE